MAATSAVVAKLPKVPSPTEMLFRLMGKPCLLARIACVKYGISAYNSVVKVGVMVRSRYEQIPAHDSSMMCVSIVFRFGGDHRRI